MRVKDYFQGFDRPASGGYRLTSVIIYKYNTNASHVNHNFCLRVDDRSRLTIRFVRLKIWKFYQNLGIGEEFRNLKHQLYKLFYFPQFFLFINFSEVMFFSPQFANLSKSRT